MNENKFAKIDQINLALENITDTVKDNLEFVLKQKGEYNKEIQKKIDEKLIILSDKINAKLEVYRQDVIDCLKEQYLSSQYIMAFITPLINAEPSPENYLNLIKSIIGIITKPYEPIVQFITGLSPKLEELTKNINELATLSLQIQQEMISQKIPNYDYSKLQIKIEPITMKDITG